jgi:putative thiazole-containing bacteriocin maturation protein
MYLRNKRQSLSLKGTAIYQWFLALEPYLDGRHTLDEIVEDLEPAQQAVVHSIVSTLLEHGFLRDCSQDPPHTLTDDTLSTYASEIAYIESCGGSAATFEQFRSQRALVIGSGLTVLAFVQATLQVGIREITIWLTDDCVTPLEGLQAIRAHTHQRDRTQMLVEQPVPNWRDERALRDALEPFDVIAHLSDVPMIQRMTTLNTFCFELQKRFLPALILDDQALIGPLVGPDAHGCWECAWRRWLAREGATERNTQYDPWQDDRTAPMSPSLGLPTAATLAHLLSFESFKHITQAGDCAIVDRILQLDLDTLRCESHGFLPHPLCRTCSHAEPLESTVLLATVRRLEQLEPLDEQSFGEQVVSCFDSSLGIFTDLGEEGFVQTPLNVSKLTISAPMYPEQTQETITLTQAHLSLEETRRRLALAGTALYAARLVDHRQLSGDAHSPVALAYDLHSKTVCQAPAQEVFPALKYPHMLRAAVGVSAGLSWAEACARGLLDHSLALALDEVRTGGVHYSELVVKAEMLEGRSRHLYRLVEHTGASMRIFQVATSLPTPILAFCLGDETVVYTAHFDTAQALEDGLERVVQRVQSAYEEQLDYALPRFPCVLRMGSETAEALSHAPALHGWREGFEWLVNQFHEAHWSVRATLLHHDPALVKTLPFLVYIWLSRQGG